MFTPSRKILTISTLLFATFFCLTGCEKNQPLKQSAPEIIPVKVVNLEPRTIRQTIEYVGNIKAQDEVQIYPKVSGKIIEKVKEEGSSVTKGDVIAYIDRDEVGLKFEKAPVESPLTGIMGRVYVDIGTHVTVQTPVALVVNMDKVKIDLDLPEKYLPQISLGQQARILVDAYPDQEFTGRIAKISPVLDLSTRSAPVEIMLDNPKHELKSGMFARLKIVLEEHKDAVVVIKEAIIGQDPDTSIYIVQDKKAVKKKITLGLREGPNYEVLSGLNFGDKIVIMGQQRLFDGALVSPEE